MTSQWWSDDDRLLAALGEALRAAQRAPRYFVDTGKAVYPWHSVDVELAALAYDSERDDWPQPRVTRTELVPLRTLLFMSAQMTIELEVTDHALVGQVVPPEVGELEIRFADGGVGTVVIDEVGAFTIQPIPPCSFRLYCRTEIGSVLTGWVLL